jgi:hypothetical protein
VQPITLRTASRLRACRRRFTATHLRGGPVLYAALCGLDGVDHGLACVGGLQRTPRLPFDPEPDHGSASRPFRSLSEPAAPGSVRSSSSARRVSCSNARSWSVSRHARGILGLDRWAISRPRSIQLPTVYWLSFKMPATSATVRYSSGSVLAMISVASQILEPGRLVECAGRRRLRRARGWRGRACASCLLVDRG